MGDTLYRRNPSSLHFFFSVNGWKTHIVKLKKKKKQGKESHAHTCLVVSTANTKGNKRSRTRTDSYTAGSVGESAAQTARRGFSSHCWKDLCKPSTARCPPQRPWRESTWERRRPRNPAARCPSPSTPSVSCQAGCPPLGYWWKPVLFFSFVFLGKDPREVRRGSAPRERAVASAGCCEPPLMPWCLCVFFISRGRLGATWGPQQESHSDYQPGERQTYRWVLRHSTGCYLSRFVIYLFFA